MKLKLHVMSDLHLEFKDYEIPQVDCDMVILAGDIRPGKAGAKWAKEQQKRLGKPIVYVAGNHEFYNNSYPKLIEELNEECAEGDVYFLEQNYIDWTNDNNPEDSVRIMGATLWTDFNLYGLATKFQSQMIASASMLDYNQIRVSTDNFRKLKTTDTEAIHNETVKWITRGINTPFKGRKVMVTHHLPSEMSVAEEYAGSLLNAAFASDLNSLIKNSGLTLWLHGHTHSVCNYKLYDTRVLCNPRGYPDEKKSGFNPELVMEV